MVCPGDDTVEAIVRSGANAIKYEELGYLYRCDRQLHTSRVAVQGVRGL